VAGPRGLYLAGGATLPEARGRGAYRALVRARWDFAVGQGTPAMTVGAQESSRPILERCGFRRFATMYELVA
jgi:GNAT superfamily N-acetyltransferase